MTALSGGEVQSEVGGTGVVSTILLTSGRPEPDQAARQDFADLVQAGAGLRCDAVVLLASGHRELIGFVVLPILYWWSERIVPLSTSERWNRFVTHREEANSRAFRIRGARGPLETLCPMATPDFLPK